MHIEPGDLQLIARLPLFAGLDVRRLGPLLAQATLRRFERDAILFLQDEPATRFYVVLDGWVRLYRETPEGQESTIGVFTRGESFAEAAIFQSGTFPVNAVVVDHARLLIIQAEPFVRQLRADPDLCLNMMASMSLHLRRLVRQIEHLTVRSSTERLADFLLRLASADQSSTIELPWDKALVAARLGMQPETLSRALARLRRLGVETRGSRITIGDFDALRRFTVGRHEPGG